MWLSIDKLFLFVCLTNLVRSEFNSPEYNKASYMMKRQAQNDELQRMLRHPQEKAQEITRVSVEQILKMLSGARDVVHLVDWKNEKVNDTVGSALASVFENTPFLMELALLYPDPVHVLVDNNPEISQLLLWAAKTTVESGLTSDADRSRIGLGLQELNVIPREANYQNPHSSTQKMLLAKKEAELQRKQKRKTSRKFPKGPRITRRRDEF